MVEPDHGSKLGSLAALVGHGKFLVTISQRHPEPFGGAQDKLREGSKVLDKWS